MKPHPLAIIIPAYKKTFLKETLQSISLQTCKDFTLYIGDDCSPHDLKSIVNIFSTELSIVYHRFSENLGGNDLVAHWKRCVSLTKGEPYIWLFSDDDIMEPHCVEEFLNLPPEIRDSYLIHFDITVIDETSHILSSLRSFPEILQPRDFVEEKLRIKHKQGLEVFVVEFIFSRKHYEEQGGFQNYDLAWGTDFITWLKIASACKGILTIKKQDCHVRWRKSLENITPNESHPVIVRKLTSLIYNAAYINKWLKDNGHHPSFLYTKFVWGNIKGYRTILSTQEIKCFLHLYVQEVGHGFLAALSFGAVMVLKSISYFTSKKC